MKGKILAILVVALPLSILGCTIGQQKLERYRDVADKAANPDRIEVYYYRKGDVKSGYECRCFGDACDTMCSGSSVVSGDGEGS